MRLSKPLIKITLVTLLARIFGFIRDFVVAKVFGVGIDTDAFFVAFKIPNLLRRIFAEGALAQSFVPVLTENKHKKGDENTRIFISDISGLLTLMLFLITALGMIIAPLIILITAPGFTKNKYQYDLTVELLRLTFPYVLFISISSFIGCILNTWNKFAVPAFSPTLLNVSMIIFSLLSTKFFNPPIMGLAISVIVGGSLQVIYQLPFLKKIGMLVIPKIGYFDNKIWKIFKSMGPTIIGVSGGQISLMINMIIASYLISGSVSWMYYADRLMEFPTAILGVTFGTILLPKLSKSVIIKDKEKYSKLLDWGLRLCFMMTLPSTFCLLFLSKQLVESIFQYGNFSGLDVIMTQKSFIGYIVGLLGLIIIKVLTPAFYSRKDISTPMRISLITLVFTQLINIFLTYPLKHEGLSLSIGISSYLNAWLLYNELVKKKIFIPQPGWSKFIVKVIFAVFVMSLSLILILNIVPDFSKCNAILRLTNLISLITISMLIYFFTLSLLKIKFKKFIKI